MKVPIKKYSAGAFIYLDGKINPGDFFIVKSGQVKIIRTNKILGDSEDIKGIGYIFGIIQSITGITEEETVQALSDCEIFQLKKDEISLLYSNHPSVILKIISEYSEILRKLDKDLVMYDIFLTSGNRSERVCEIAEKYIAIGQPDKASRLLNSFILEPDVDSQCVSMAKSMLNKVPGIPFELYNVDNIIQHKRINKGTIIFTEYELGNSMFIIKKGKVKITKLKNDKEILLAVIGEGQIFGEMSIFNDKPRNATAYAVENTDLMIVDEKGLRNLPPSIFVKTLELLTKRIWFVQQQLMAYKFPFPPARLYYFLYAKLKQLNPRIEHDSNRGHVFSISLDDLFLMTDFDKDNRSEAGPFLSDDNFEFTTDSIKVRSIKKLLDKKSYYFARLDSPN